MRIITWFAASIVLGGGTAFAAQTNGNAALALAALVGDQSPALSRAEKDVLARFLDGETRFPLPRGLRIIVVRADKIVCRMGDVDITTHACRLSFGPAAVAVSGRRGQELLATMQENGVAADGAAGTIFYSVAPLVCTIDPAEVQSNGGGGARCDFTNGP
jgi:hypothetical protein